MTKRKSIAKNNADVPFTWRGEIDKASEPWTGFQIKATSAYWYTRQSWLYFKNIHSRSGMDDVLFRVRVHSEHSADDGSGTFYQKTGFANNLTFSSYSGFYLGNYHDIVSHEFTHGIIKNSSALIGSDESGALNESFADIFGLMAERITVNGEVETNLNWELGDGDIFRRLLNNPNGAGNHAVVGCSRSPGQPDTYEGLYWSTEDCPEFYGDKHSKGGVQNFWFYILSEGGSGSNDNSDVYSVSGIGETKASKIAFWSMVNILGSSSQYSDARAGAIAAAQLLYGECSNEFIQTTNAWYAVGVGAETTCANASVYSEDDFEDFTIYPNPMTHHFTISWESQEQFDVTVYGVDGKMVLTQKSVTNGQHIIPPNISKGVYIVEVKSGEKSIRKRVIKN